ncbi:MAG: tetratricopeptide repeat protein [Gammaproteobacteria bacterium]|nr:tetratricopeptide repeat protein [Pseudacidovorax sp.]MBP6896866.1 tetratricopeptide repeat protein [Pseudacidovorax sp.]
MNDLPSAIHADIKQICADGDALAEQRLYKEAIATYNKAWVLLPAPQADWESSTWILAAIGDACFLGGFFVSGSEAMEYAMRCPSGFGNPFLHLRLGQSALERGQNEVAAEHLARAYMLEGKEIFALDDPKYFAFLKTKLAPPASGVW